MSEILMGIDYCMSIYHYRNMQDRGGSNAYLNKDSCMNELVHLEVSAPDRLCSSCGGRRIAGRCI